jgi:ComF family protein
MNVLPFVQGLWQATLRAIFPPRCLVCNTHYVWQPSTGKVASYPVSDVIAPYFCESCQKGLTPITHPFCSKCGLPFVSTEGVDHTCSECFLERRYFGKARAFGIYDGILMEAIHLLKYGKKTSLAQPLSGLAKKTFFKIWDAESIDMIISVPLHIKRLRQRGFNQAHLLTMRWAKQEGITLDGVTLCRSRWTEPQTKLSRTERRKNIKGAFSLENTEKITGQKILLVDDVFTTGATVNECARVLTKAGAEFVDVLTLARAV